MSTAVGENKDSVVVKAELPGVDPKEVEISMEDGTLYLKGERKSESEDQRDGYHRLERSYGSFARAFTLPELFPQTNLTLPSRAVVRFYNKRGTAEQWIKEGKQAVKNAAQLSPVPVERGAAVAHHHCL